MRLEYPALPSQLLSGVLQHYFPDLPNWVLPLGYGAGILLLGVSLGLFGAGGLKRKRLVRQRASLRLHIFGDHRALIVWPKKTFSVGYYLQMVINGLGPEGHQRLTIGATLFVTFVDDVAMHTLRVRLLDLQLPVNEVKEFNQRYASLCSRITCLPERSKSRFRVNEAQPGAAAGRQK